jgi:hypothetical protein
MARCRAFLGKRKYDNGEEEWKEFMYHDKYEISNMGNMRRKNPPFIVNPIIEEKRAPRVKINGVHYMLARMVAMHFIPNPENHPWACFINGDNMDCRASNLMWNKKSTTSKHSKAHSRESSVEAKRNNWRDRTNIHFKSRCSTG